MTDSSPPPTETTVEHPTRGAERNRTLLDRADPATDRMLLPSLDEGITLLDVEDDRGVTVVHSLVLDHLLMQAGSVFWVDAEGYATTTTLARMAPGRRLLDRIHVARGFTATQHYGAVCELPAAVPRSIREPAPTESGAPVGSSPCGGSKGEPPSLLVAPAVDAQYRSEDTLGRSHTETLLARTLARLADYAERYGIPVLVTRTDADEFTASVEAAADHRLRCEQTAMGARFVGEGFETLVYPVGDGAYYQTTLSYWRQLLDARARQVGMEPGSTAQSTGRTDRSEREAVTPTPDPLVDAWVGANEGR